MKTKLILFLSILLLTMNNMDAQITWTLRTQAVGNAWRSVTYGNGLFVAVSSSGSGNRVMTSPDGITWTSRTSAADNYWISVTYGNGLFVAVSATGSGDRVMTSPDGITWTIRTSAADLQWRSVTYGNGIFVAVGDSGTGNRVMTSSDGITWTSRTSAADNNWFGVTYGNGLFVAVSQSGTGNRVMTSPDGITWTSRTSAADNAWLSVTYANGLFVAVGQSGTGNRVMTSPDGITWTSRTSAADSQWNAVAFGNGLFAAIATSGASGQVMTSDCPSTAGDTTVIACDSFAWNGITYTSTPGVAPTKTLTNVAGCDSILTLHLTITECTQLSSSSCGATLSNLNQKVYCDNVAAATNYKYKIEHAATSYSAIKVTSDTNILLANIAGIEYGKTYTVSISNYSNSAWSAFGPVCSITTPAIEPKLMDASCGATLSNLSQKVFCKKITAATNYKYKFEHAATSYSAIKVSSDTSIVLASVAGIGFGKTYTVRVSYYSNSVWSPFGAVCNVTTPAEPKLADASCGTTLTNLTEKIFGRSIANATNYKYKIEHTATSYSAIKVSADTSFTLASIAGITYGKTYTVSVSYYSNGIWSPFGSVCNVTTPAVEPKLTDASCGATINNLSQQKVFWKQILAATNYKFKIVHAATSFSRTVTTGSADTSIALSTVAGITYGKTYAVQIAYYSNGVWSPFGSVCSVITTVGTMPLFGGDDGQNNEQTEEDMNAAATLGINEGQTQENIVVYPNPVVDLVTIIGSEKFTQIEVLNVLGQTVIQQSNANKQNNLNLNVSVLQEGTYFIRLKDDENNFIIRKVLKK